MGRVFLFDIDNTLLYTGGAGTAAMNEAFRQMFGIEDGFAGVEFSGRTDLHILAEGLKAHGIEGDPAGYLEEFAARYCELLPKTLRERQGRLMPGFPQLLEALAQEPGARIGLATGNFSRSAQIKLRFYGIDGYFAGGGFGEDSVDRAKVVRAAIERVADGAAPEEIYVIGDTPHDITSALDNGAVGVGVATGSYGVEELRASGAKLVFADFADWPRAAQLLLGKAGS